MDLSLEMLTMTTSARKTILLIDDDELLRTTLAEQLELLEDMDCVQAGTASEGLSAAKARPFDALIVDVGLPDMDGRDLCRLLRKAGVKSPIVMLTGMSDDADTVIGLDAGANDYIAKPFKLNVLIARLRAQIRSHEQSDDATFIVGPYHFRPALKMLQEQASGRKIKLTEKETAILKYLYRAGGKLVRREDLLNEVWGYHSEVNTHTLETHIYRLRQKIDLQADGTPLVVTEPGGYRLG